LFVCRRLACRRHFAPPLVRKKIFFSVSIAAQARAHITVAPAEICRSGNIRAFFFSIIFRALHFAIFFFCFFVAALSLSVRVCTNFRSKQKKMLSIPFFGKAAAISLSEAEPEPKAIRLSAQALENRRLRGWPQPQLEVMDDGGERGDDPKKRRKASLRKRKVADASDAGGDDSNETKRGAAGRGSKGHAPQRNAKKRKGAPGRAPPAPPTATETGVKGVRGKTSGTMSVPTSGVVAGSVFPDKDVAAQEMALGSAAPEACVVQTDATMLLLCELTDSQHAAEKDVLEAARTEAAACSPKKMATATTAVTTETTAGKVLQGVRPNDSCETMGATKGADARKKLVDDDDGGGDDDDDDAADERNAARGRRSKSRVASGAASPKLKQTKLKPIAQRIDGVSGKDSGVKKSASLTLRATCGTDRKRSAGQKGAADPQTASKKRAPRRKKATDDGDDNDDDADVGAKSRARAESADEEIDRVREGDGERGTAATREGGESGGEKTVDESEEKDLPLPVAVPSRSIALLRRLEPELRHISETGPNMHVVSLGGINGMPNDLPETRETVRLYNVSHYSLWSQLCSKSDLLTHIGHQARQRDMVEAIRANKRRDLETDISRNSIGAYVPVERIPVTGSPPTGHVLLHVHFSCKKNADRYWCMRFRGAYCVYDTFWYDGSVASYLPPDHPLLIVSPVLSTRINTFPWDELQRPDVLCIYYEAPAKARRPRARTRTTASSSSSASASSSSSASASSTLPPSPTLAPHGVVPLAPASSTASLPSVDTTSVSSSQSVSSMTLVERLVHFSVSVDTQPDGTSTLRTPYPCPSAPSASFVFTGAQSTACSVTSVSAPLPILPPTSAAVSSTPNAFPTLLTTPSIATAVSSRHSPPPPPPPPLPSLHNDSSSSSSSALAALLSRTSPPPPMPPEGAQSLSPKQAGR
jgi:hypothetical protein